MNDLVETRGTETWCGGDIAKVGFKRGRALVVDDDAALLGLIADALTRVGFEIIKARDAIDALSSMYARCPDGVLVDLAMPRMSGIDLIAQVCTETRFREVTVVAMSGHEDMLRRATEAGASDALVKPLSIRRIIAAFVQRKYGRSS
jgi:DNA-binding response OmpR family regulator